MAYGCGLALIVTLFLLESSALLHSAQQQFIVGIWSNSPADTVVHKFQPALETYLTSEIGPLYDPPINFKLVPMDYNSSNSADALVAMGQLDFAYANGAGLTCLEAQYGFTQIATQTQITLQKETSSYGTVLFSLKSNDNIQSISDFAGKRIGVGHPWAAGTFTLGFQVVFYFFDNANLLNDIILGKIDVGILQSGYIESTFPQNLPLLRYHGITNVSFEGDPYPFPTTTYVVPTYGLSASPNITLALREQVADALAQLNKTHPAAKAAGIKNFGFPASYELQRVMVEEQGFLVTTPTGKRRTNIFAGPENFIICPSGYKLERPEALFNGCRKAGLTCPIGYSCFCQPCHPDYSVSIFPWQTVLGLCLALFVTGLCFSVVWVFFLYSGTLFIKLFVRARRATASYKGGGMKGMSSSSMYSEDYGDVVKDPSAIASA